MSQAEALLASLSAAAHEHSHPVPDTDASFVIDPYSRLIENANYQKNVLMQRDHNSERFTFEIPRYVDGHDMSLCNRVIVHFDNISTDGSTMNSDVAYMTDLQLNPKNEETVISSWLITREATQIVGILSFSIQYLCVEADGTISYEWSTDSFEEIEIRKSKNNGEASVVKYSNVLEQWRQDIFGAGDSVMANITAEGETQVASVKEISAAEQEAIELKGSETLATIPEDYTEVYNMASEAVRTKADGVICEAEGEAIAVNDSSDDYIRGLNVYGKTTQATTSGAQLAYIPDVESYENNGITWRSNGGIVTAKGNAPIHSYTPSNIHADLTGLVGTFYLSGNGKYIKVAVQCTRDGVTSYINAPQEFTLDGTETRVELYCRITTYNTDINDTAYPLVNIGNTVLPWEPYTGGMPSPNPEYPQELTSIENPSVSIIGRNLIRYPYRAESAYNNGITFTANSDGTVTANGTATDTAYFTMQNIADYSTTIPISKGTYVLSGAPIEYCRVAIALWKNKKKAATYSAYVRQPLTFTIDEDDITFDVVCTVDTGAILDNVVFKPQLEAGSVPTPYEPYKPSQPLTLNRTIPGIHVAEGGNYTDSDGQQWICDEVDLARGVYVQRVNTRAIAGHETMNTSADKWQRDGMFSVYMNILSPETEYASDNVGLFHYALSPQCMSNTWEWMQHTGLNNIAARKSIVYISLADSVTGILAEDDDTTKLSKFKTYLAAQYAAGTPITVQYILATPIETPLTAEEIEAYKSLKTNYPYTTVLNDSGAWMKTKYNADTKLYIDNAAVNGAATVVEEVLNDTY